MSRWLIATIGPSKDEDQPDYSGFIKEVASRLGSKQIPSTDVRYIEDEPDEIGRRIYKKEIVEKEQAEKVFNYVLGAGIYLREYLKTDEGRKELVEEVEKLRTPRDVYEGEDEEYVYTDEDSGEDIYKPVQDDKVYTRPTETLKYFFELFFNNK